MGNAIFQVIPPPAHDHADTYHRMLGCYIPPEKLDALLEVFGEDFHFLFNALAGCHVRFPKLRTFSDLQKQAQVYDLVEGKKQDGVSDDEAFEQVAGETRMTIGKVRRFHGMAVRQLGRVSQS